jgi:hypothetical protein
MMIEEIKSAKNIISLSVDKVIYFLQILAFKGIG